MPWSKKYILSAVLLIYPSHLLAKDGLFMSFGAMALTNSTTQGGEGASGSTVLTETELTWHEPWWGIGAYFQYDKHGTAEIDSGTGVKLELHWDPIYLEFGHTFMMKRAFTDRSIATQNSKANVFGIGARFPIGSGTEVDGPFMQFVYKYRSQIIKDQDGTDLNEPITQKDGYPLFGFGYDF